MAEDEGRGPYRIFCGLCPDEECQAKLFFPSYDTSIECTSCGQRHERGSLKSVEEVTNPEVMIHNILREMLIGKTKPKKGTDSVKVLGLSNFQCKLISPLLTRYGMDKQGKAKMLSDMGQGTTFDCSKLGDRAFLLEPENIEVAGYGRDRTGSMNYLKDTLYAIQKCNGDEERLLPIHADGDGHCLVHAVSRALVGRELFWHALRENLKEHFCQNLDRYKMLFRDFVDKDEWQDIIEECDPEFIPRDGEPLGMRNIHIFGLANILRRPIILLDSISGIQSSGDYSGVFLPGMVDPSECRNKDGVLHKPLCLAWSSSGRNHYIALVGIRGLPLARLPGWMLPKAWGMPQEEMSRYTDLDLEDCCFIGGDKCLPDKYILKLARAMEEVFLHQFGVSAALVADVHHYVYRSTGMVGIKPEIVLGETQREVNGKRLYRCLRCEAVSIFNVTEGLTRGGKLYQLAVDTHGPLRADKNYSFPLTGLICSYDAEKDELIPDMNRSRLSNCQWCQGTMMRLMTGDGEVQYINGDRTTTRTSSSRCQCGFKHYWDGKEYDNWPEIFPVTLEWNGKVVGEKVVWFQFESDTTMNSNVFEVAQQIVQKHFPGAFGSERLVQKVVDSILRQSAAPNEEGAEKADANPADDPLNWAPDTASKIILTGRAKNSRNLHKEELTKSETEKSLHQRVHQKAATEQQKASTDLQRGSKMDTSSPKSSPGKKRLSSEPSSSAPSSVTSSSGGGDLKPATVTSAGQMPKQKKVRVTTSDGRQLTLSLEGDTSYSDLQSKLESELGVAPQRQRIKHGFPPRELVAPSEDKQDEPLPIQHGDRITVEILPEQSTSALSNAQGMTASSVAAARPQGAWGGPAVPSLDTTEMLIKGLTDLQQSSSDKVDTSIASLALMASLTGREMWDYVQSMPHLFTIGGLFYEQVKRDLGLTDGKHCTLPSIPGKVFRYSTSSDCLELCLEPHGHFPVEPGIEERILGTSVWKEDSPKKEGSLAALRSSRELQAEKEVRQALTVGSSGIILDKTMKYPKAAFTGQGHTLSGSGAGQGQTSDQGAPMSDLEEQATNTAAVPVEAEQSHEEGMDTSEVTAEATDKDPVFVRVGPGCTVLDHRKTNAANETSEQFQSLAATIQAAVEESERKDEDVATSNKRSIDSVTGDIAATGDDIETLTSALLSAVGVPPAAMDNTGSQVYQDKINELVRTDEAKNVITMDVEVPSSVDKEEKQLRMETVSSGGDVAPDAVTSGGSDMETVITSAGESSHQNKEAEQKSASETMDSS